LRGKYQPQLFVYLEQPTHDHPVSYFQIFGNFSENLEMGDGGLDLNYTSCAGGSPGN
jgi:hypothetical protein